ncbi:hypothetical protein BLAT2472_20106 [Burkholderia latens]
MHHPTPGITRRVLSFTGRVTLHEAYADNHAKGRAVRGITAGADHVRLVSVRDGFGLRRLFDERPGANV